MASCEGNSSNVPCLSTSQTASIPPQAAVVNRQPLSFSISRILGLEENGSQYGNTSNHGMSNVFCRNNVMLLIMNFQSQLARSSTFPRRLKIDYTSLLEICFFLLLLLNRPLMVIQAP